MTSCWKIPKRLYIRVLIIVFPMVLCVSWPWTVLLSEEVVEMKQGGVLVHPLSA